MLLFAPFLFTYLLSYSTCCSVTFSPSHTINQPLSEVSGEMQLPIVYPESVAHKQPEKQSFRLVTFNIFVVFAHAPHPLLQDLFPLSFHSFHYPPFFHVQPPHSTSPSTLHLSPPPILSAFIYLWVALTVFLWWITLSSCMLLSSVTGGEEQHQSCSYNSGSIGISVCELDW